MEDNYPWFRSPLEAIYENRKLEMGAWFTAWNGKTEGGTENLRWIFPEDIPDILDSINTDLVVRKPCVVPLMDRAPVVTTSFV